MSRANLSRRLRAIAGYAQRHCIGCKLARALGTAVREHRGMLVRVRDVPKDPPHGSEKAADASVKFESDPKRGAGSTGGTP